MLDLSRLRALHAISVHGSVAGAAAALGYTPSAVSQQITKLERETRTTLLERRGRGVALTEEALHLAATAQQLLAIVEQAETTLEERRGLPTGRLSIGAFASAARGLLPGVLADLDREHPALDVRMTEVDPHLSVDLVAKGVIDLAVAHDWDIAPLPAPEGVAQAVIGEDRCDLLVPAATGWRAGTTGCDARSWRGSGGSASRPGRSATTGSYGRCARRATSRTSGTRPRRTTPNWPCSPPVSGSR